MYVHARALCSHHRWVVGRQGRHIVSGQHRRIACGCMAWSQFGFVTRPTAVTAGLFRWMLQCFDVCCYVAECVKNGIRHALFSHPLRYPALQSDNTKVFTQNHCTIRASYMCIRGGSLYTFCIEEEWTSWRHEQKFLDSMEYKTVASLLCIELAVIYHKFNSRCPLQKWSVGLSFNRQHHHCAELLVTPAKQQLICNIHLHVRTAAV